VHVEDPVRPGHDLDGADLVLPLLEQPRRQTGGVRERSSGDAVLDANVAAVGHERIVSETMARMATMADLDELALAMPQTTKEVSEDGRPSYLVHGKMFCFHRSRRPDAVDPETGERMDDVLMFRVDGLDEKELLLADERGVYFTTPHFRGYPAVLVRIPDLARIDRDELRDLVAVAWLTRAQKRVAKAWLAEQGIDED
jgi:hypothetical protein